MCSLSYGDFSQPRGAAGAPAGDAVARAAERADPAKDLTAALASVLDLPRAPELREGGRLGRRPPLDADLPGEALEERSMTDTRPLAAERPCVGGLVAEGFLALGPGEVRGDRDRMRRAVDDLASGQLAARQPDPRRIEPEAKGDPVVLALEARLFVRLSDFEERIRGPVRVHDIG